YIGGCYRYEKPQAGRLREFHQFGVECIGAPSPNADAEVIALARQVLESVGIEKIALEINSIGCPECRKAYHAALKEYFKANIDTLCGTCKERLDRNPMRILDCKSPICSEIAAKAPVVLDFLCDDCRDHFEQVKAHLTAQGIEYTVNPHIVRGLDYYTRTVFEFVSGDIGAQSTVCGGGRYDGLISQMGGPAVASLGFGMGIERLMLLLKAQQTELPEAHTTDIYIATLGDKAILKASELCAELRREGYKAETDICSRGLKAQMKFADKIGAKFTVVLGDDEIDGGKARLKDMAEGTVKEIKLSELTEELGEAIREQIFKNIAEIM
ncbi:MAG: histidine--tRNA ligase, partial [Clostridia bacterium]|nr:histidine--tRNA ligase [Clostridia bacterium]